MSPPFYQHSKTKLNTLLSQHRQRQIKKIRISHDIEDVRPLADVEEDNRPILSRIRHPQLEYGLQQEETDQTDVVRMNDSLQRANVSQVDISHATLDVEVKKQRRRGITSAAELVEQTGRLPLRTATTTPQDQDQSRSGGEDWMNNSDVYEPSSTSHEVKSGAEPAYAHAVEISQSKAQTGNSYFQLRNACPAQIRDTTKSTHGDGVPFVHSTQCSPVLHSKASSRFSLDSSRSHSKASHGPTSRTQKTFPVLAHNEDVDSSSKLTRGMSQLGTFEDDDNNTSISNLPLHASSKGIDPASLPDHPTTAQLNQLPAISFTSRGTKRKRGQGHTLLRLPTSFRQRHHHQTHADFNLFTALLDHPELILHFASWLPSQTLVNLYSISRAFHVIVNQRFTTVVLNQATRKCPGASKIWPWRSYARLCQVDPAGINHGVCIKPVPAAAVTYKQQQHNHHSTATTTDTPTTPASTPPSVRPKIVPTFRWLHLSLHRTTTLHTLLAHFAQHALPLPPSILPTLQKLWFLYDIPDNPRRITYIHTRSLFSDADLCLALTFVVRLDMLLHDPVAGEKRDGIRKLLLSLRDGFDGVLAVLRRERWASYEELFQSWVRYGLRLDFRSSLPAGSDDSLDQSQNQNQTATVTATAISAPASAPLTLALHDLAHIPSVFGVPVHELGQLKKEHWGQSRVENRIRQEPKRYEKSNARYLMRIDQLLLRESVRRGLCMRGHIYRSVMWGFVDPETLEAGVQIERGGSEEEGGLDVKVSWF